MNTIIKKVQHKIINSGSIDDICIANAIRELLLIVVYQRSGPLILTLPLS